MVGRNRARDYETLTFFVAPHATPTWLSYAPGRGSIGTVEVDASMLRSSGNFPEGWPLSDFSKKEYLTHLQSDRSTAEKVYFRAARRDDELERGILEGIGVRHNGSPVWWTDLESGPVQAATMFDLVRLANKPQPWTSGRGKKKKTMWLMSLEQWDKAEYPPESQGGPPYVPNVSIARERAKKRKRR